MVDKSFLPLLFQEELEKEIFETDSIKAGKEWIESGDLFWISSGKVGCGKSLAAIHTGLLLMEKGFLDKAGNQCFHSRPFTRAKIPILQIKSQNNPEELTHPDYFKNWLLILEELGTEYIPVQPEYWFNKLDALIDERYERKLKTIITTNKSFQDLQTIYPERFLNRLKGMSYISEASESSLRGKVRFLNEKRKLA